MMDEETKQKLLEELRKEYSVINLDKEENYVD